MRLVSKIALGVVMFFALAVLGAGLWSYRLLRQSFPQTRGEINLDSLKADVTVYRDADGVPHIFATNEDDLFFAAGYVTAQDRLWQMDFNRRVARGRLSEIFGPRTLDTDRFLLTLGCYRTAQEIVEKLAPQSRRILQAYANGVNAFIRQSRGHLPLEFRILGYTPEEWRIEDSLAFARIMAWNLCFAWRVDLVLGELVEKLGEAKARQVFPGYPEGAPTIVSEDLRGFSSLGEPLLAADAQIKSLMGLERTASGSNSWAISGSKALGGKPILANDPHLGYSLPPVWYESHLRGGDLDVAGLSLPGAPAIIIGHTPHHAWGLTNAMIDDADFYVEKIHPEDSTKALYANRWEPMRIWQEEVPVKGQQPARVTVRLTRHGPVISDFHPALKASKKAVSMRWTGHEVSDETMAFYLMARAKSWNEFTAALQWFRVPGQNVVYADRDGHIGYWCAGALPIRRNGEGVLPHRGWETNGDWIAFVPFDELPHAVDPPEGFIVTANNQIAGEDYPFYIGALWESPSRAERIREILNSREKFSAEDFQRLQMDDASPLARFVTNSVVKAVATDFTLPPEIRVLVDTLKQWNHHMDEKSAAAAVYNVFFVRFLHNLFADEMGDPLFRIYADLPNVSDRVVETLLRRGESSWFDDITTPDRVESLVDILRKSLVEAREELVRRLDRDPANWTWGDLHTVSFKHPLADAFPLKSTLQLRLGPYPIGGCATTINKQEYSYANPYASLAGPSTRQIVDFANPRRTYSVIPTGQSGQPFHRHFRDQVELWRKGQYRTVLMDSSEIAKACQEILTLKKGGVAHGAETH